MTHNLDSIAATHRFNRQHLEAYCRNETSMKVFSLQETNGLLFVSSWYVDHLIHNYREMCYNQFGLYLRHKGYLPSKIRRNHTGYEAEITSGLHENSTKDFTSLNGNLASLSFIDYTNEQIVGDFKF